MKIRRQHGNKSHSRMFFLQNNEHHLREEREEGIWAEIDLTQTAWMTHAVCTNADPEAFFTFESSVDRRMLARICAECPVRAECLDYALRNDMHGYWGGTTRFERRKMMKDAS